MEEKFCSDHSNVMRCLGVLEGNSERNYNSIVLLHQKFDKLLEEISKGKVNGAVEKTKSGILYWIIATTVGCAIAVIVSRFFVYHK